MMRKLTNRIMKIAYLITSYGEYEHLKRLLTAINAPYVLFFLHIDAKSTMPDNLYKFDNLTFIPRKKVWWGSWSHMEVILDDLMNASTNATIEFDYCILISDTDYPIKPNEELLNILSSGGEFINANKGFCSHKPEKRIKYYYFDGFDHRQNDLKSLFSRSIEILLRPIVYKRHYPFEQAWVDTVWSALSIACVRYILEYVDKNPDYVAFFRTAKIPEEIFLHTIIGNSKYAMQVRGNLTYTDWTNSTSGPAQITLEHISALHNCDEISGRTIFFARKFKDDSIDVIKTINTNLLKTKHKRWQVN